MITLILISSFAMAETRSEILKEINVQAIEAGVDPDLAVAIARVESGLNPKARGALGEIGLFQLRPEYHNVIEGNSKHNTKIALTYLSQIQKKWAPTYGNAWFVLYNWGPYNRPKKPRETQYYQKVMREVGQIKYKRYLAVN